MESTGVTRLMYALHDRATDEPASRVLHQTPREGEYNATYGGDTARQIGQLIRSWQYPCLIREHGLGDPTALMFVGNDTLVDVFASVLDKPNGRPSFVRIYSPSEMNALETAKELSLPHTFSKQITK